MNNSNEILKNLLILLRKIETNYKLSYKNTRCS